ncbi:hypothetical protein COB11_00580 [Candidatus Aerophobetes bacterium]|uniref:Uncharacterized protein n=1 Tax=Aerophobetes bacterium TaxID=2030807 RepID=A0A2A4YNY1_UNCAE|nr:MAG: hypothetical protein COB11_00580 [Candidatus Aerophobetes bacterium]
MTSPSSNPTPVPNQVLPETIQPNKKRFFKTPWKVTILALVCAAVAFGIVIYVHEKMTYVWTNDAFIEGYGVDLSSNVTEKVTDLFVDEGDFVKKGQIIAVLQNNVPLAQKKEAEAKIVSTEQEIVVKEAYYLKIRNDYERALKGIEDRIISEQDFDHAQKNFEMAVGELDLAKANYILSKKQLEVVEAQLTHYIIEAPRDGMIAKRWIWFGDVVRPGQSLYTMFDLEDVWVLANLEEKKIRKVKLGDKVKIHIDAYPGVDFYGEIFTIKGAAASKFTLIPQNNATGNYTKVEQRVPVKISIKRPSSFSKDEPLYLFPGMSAEVYVKVR